MTVIHQLDLDEMVKMRFITVSHGGNPELDIVRTNYCIRTRMVVLILRDWW